MPAQPNITKGQVKDLPLSCIEIDPDNIRKTFDPEGIKQLAADIKLRELEQPIVVTKNGDGKFRIKHGERRYRAFKHLKRKNIPCILATQDTGEDADFNRLAAQFAENMQREDLNPIDMAHFFKTCRDEYGMSAKEIPAYLKGYGINIDYNESTIRNYIRLTELPDWAKQMIRTGQLTARHGRALLPILKSDAVAEAMKKELDAYFLQDEADLDPEDIMTVNRLTELVCDIYEHFYPHANTFEMQWMPASHEAKVLYDVDSLDKEIRDQLNIVEFTNPFGRQNDKFILNQELHEQLQKEAREAKKSGGKNADGKTGTSSTGKSTATGSTDTTDKPEPRTEASQERLQDWFHAYLTRWILIKLDSMKPVDRRPIFESLLIYAALNLPDNYTRAGYEIHFNDNAREALDVDELACLLDNPVEIGKAANAIALALFGDSHGPADNETALDFRNTVILAYHLWFDIGKDITIDADYMAMYTSAGIEKIIHQAGLQDNPLWKATVKVADKRDYAVSAAAEIGTTEELKKLWIDTVPA